MTDYLDSPAFKTLLRDYWNGLPWHQHIDQVRDAIRANYKPDTSRTIRELRKQLAERDQWIERLTEKK